MREAYDIIIVGGGHNGLVAARALAQAGFSTCVAEARDRVGGCAATTEPLLPLFRHSPHANCFLFADIMADGLAPAELGVPLIQPEAQLGIAFADGRPPVILHRPDLQARTRASLTAYSRRDAARYVEMKRRSARLGPLLREGLYRAPDPDWFDRQRNGILKAFEPFVDRATLGRGTARRLIDGLFGAAEIRMLLYALASETGVALEDPGSDIAFLGFSLWIAGRWRVPVGGMQSYSDALAGAARLAGAELSLSTPVEQVLVKDGHATGIRTGGRDIGATVAVIAATPILTLFDRLLATTDIAARERAELDAFRRSSAASIGTSAFCLDWEPRYRSGRHDPAIDRCLKTVIGFASPADMLQHAADAAAGLLPWPAGVVRVHSLWDPAMAPPGQHIAAIDSGFPAMAAMAPDSWRLVAAAFPTALFETWQSHLADQHPPPPMAMSLDDMYGFERRMLIRLGSDQYRTSVDGLYLAGPGVYPGGGVHGACGLNAAATVIADRGGAR